MTGQISVVVPFYNNAGQLGECLDSIAAQTHPDLQVIMVDDGSTDDSAEVAAARAAADPRFTLIRVPNGGPGAARNRGVEAAAGEYLAFVDADDELPPDAYAVLLASLERSGSDFVTGGVRRLTAAGLGKSGMHALAIKSARAGTHISRSPELFYDVSVWNKLFRRSFWDSAGLRLPEGMLWEDLVAMTQAHVLAGAVDVITHPVYHWRDRDADAPSITQSRTDIANLRDRITALRMIDDFLRARATPVMVDRHQRKALVNDLWLYVRDLRLTSQEYQSEFVAQARSYLGTVRKAVLADLPAAHKLGYHLIAAGRTAELAGLSAWLADHPGRTPPMTRSRGRLVADLPLRGDRGLAIPARVFRPHRRDFDPRVRVERISWRDGRLVIEGWACVPSIDIGRRRDTAKLLVLVPRGGRRPPVLLPARSVRRPDVTAASGQDRCSYDWAGFRCAIGPGLFRAGRRWLAGDWDCYLLVRGRTVVRPARLHSPGPDAEYPQEREIAPGLVLGPRWAGDRLVIGLRREPGPVADGGGERGAESGEGRRPGPVADRERVAVRPSWRSDGALVLAGGQLPPGEYQLELRHAGAWDRHCVPAAVIAGELSATVPVAAMELFGERRPLRDGRWQLTLLRTPPAAPPGPRDDGPSPSSQRQRWAIDVTEPGGPVTAGRKRFRCERAADGGLVLAVGPVLGLAERGRVRRKLVRELWYRAQRLLPVRDVILFSSFHGKQCGDNPGAIAAELRRRGDRRDQVWAVADWSVVPPAGAGAVLIGTAAYFAALARSRYLIVNDHLPSPYRKRAGQRHVQTWHGTPCKRLGYDIGAPAMASGRRYLDHMAADVAQWDLLLSPNPFSTPIMRRAFGYAGEICETGYPRDDALAGGGGPLAGQIRRRLGLPAGPRVALYVPTWRDDEHDAAGRYLLDFRIDLGAARDALAGEFTLLIRGHHLMAGGGLPEVPLPGEGGPGFALDVTGYPDINDLLLVADVLITDYSSVMFDFAPSGRPMLFFTYDLERYRDRLRGFYFDFEAQAPGPLLATSEELVGALAEIDSVAQEYQGKLAAFAARFCPLDDGKAAARACDRIFGG